MYHRPFALIVLFALVAALASGCGAAKPTPEPLPAEEATPPAGGASTSQLASGLHTLPDGSVQAVGTLEYSNLEGGFWQVAGFAPGGGDTATVFAVIANGADFESQLKPLEGKSVIVTGKPTDGASIRMAGPEIVMVSVSEVSEMNAPAQ